MEDMFELLVALLVIAVPLISKSKKKKQERPGRKKAEKAPKPAPVKPKVDPEALKYVLEEAEEKVNELLVEMKPADAGADMQPQRMQAERLVPEPLVPQSMAATPLEEVGIGEGQSRTDDAGCIGGSMSHDPQAHHQGMDFHPHGTHGRGLEEPMVVQHGKTAVSAAELRRAVLWKEILDQPVSMRK